MDPTDHDVVDEDGLRRDLHEKSQDVAGDSRNGEDQGRGQVDEVAEFVAAIWIRTRPHIDSQCRLRRCLLLAAFACILRPTNILIWICTACFTVLSTTGKGNLLSLPWEGAQAWIQITTLYLFPANRRERLALFREVTTCGYVFRVRL